MVAFVMMLIFIGVGIHYKMAHRSQIIESTKNISRLVSNSKISLGLSYDEERESLHGSYPEMIPISRMNFIYER